MPAKRSILNFIFYIVPLFLFLLVILFWIYYLNVTYEVTQVIDGDTFAISDGRRIRLLSVDAPELRLCMGREAKDTLTDLILRKRVFIKSQVTDDYGRIVANVYEKWGFINGILVKKGLAKYTSGSNPEAKELKTASDYARTHSSGIYSSVCRQISRDAHCQIKANIRKMEKVYYLPTCPYYKQVIVDLSFGDRWFCTEDEAVNAGFLKSTYCH